MDVMPGAMAREFALADDGGGCWRLPDHRGRPVLLIFHRHLA